MPLQQISYEEARELMQPGDVIAFGGKGNFSEIIKMATFSEVSHVGVILQTGVRGENNGRFFNQIIESTSLGDFNGVQINRFSDRLAHYDGDLWWLPLDKALRIEFFDQEVFYNFLFQQDHKPYDMPQAVGSALDLLDKLGAENREDFNKFFCSELVAAALEKIGLVPKINASEVTPIELCRWDIYDSNYYQLKGPPKPISKYSSIQT